MASVDISDDSSKYQEEVEEEVLEDGVEDLEIKNETPKDKKMKGAIQSMMKQMVSSKQPFYKMSLPICFSEPRSLLEKFSDMGKYFDIFLAASELESAENRFLEILKFYISCWFQHKDVRNPFNPVIGEIHSCKWQHKDNTTTEYISEQISHHPPSSAFCFHNKQKGALFHSYLSPSSKFWGNSFESSMEGKLIFELSKLDEEYIVEPPKITVKGVVVGTLTTEVIGSTTLQCKKSGYYADIEFRGRGLFKNKYSLLAKIKHQSSKKSLYTLEGFWDGTINIINCKTNQTSSFFNSETHPVLQPQLPCETEQSENFSRKVWKNVIQHILEDNDEDAQSHKYQVEENQRAIAKSREGKPWSPVHFNKSDQSYFYFKLSEIRKECLVTK